LRQHTITVLNVLEPVRNVSHIPMNPISIPPISHKFEKGSQENSLNLIKMLEQVRPIYTKLLCNCMCRKASCLLRRQMHHYDRGDPGRELFIFAIQVLARVMYN
jgi:hypothetical protein